MKLRPTALSSLVLATILLITSCEKDAEKNKVLIYAKSGIAMTGAQETPANPSTATGSLNVTYNKSTKTLSYQFSWTGLTGPVTAFHIHGLAPVGYQAIVFQGFTASNITPCTTGGPTSCGSYSGTLVVDGFAIKEVDLLNGMYYVNIHTATYGGGEIRGQIRFQ